MILKKQKKNIISIHFDTKNYLKSNYYHTTKHNFQEVLLAQLAHNHIVFKRQTNPRTQISYI